MVCFAIARYTVLDQGATAEYSALSAPIMAAYGGEIVHRGKRSLDLAGMDQYEFAVVATFPTLGHARDWHASADYQRLLQLRSKGVDIILSVYE